MITGKHDDAACVSSLVEQQTQDRDVGRAPRCRQLVIFGEVIVDGVHDSRDNATLTSDLRAKLACEPAVRVLQAALVKEPRGDHHARLPTAVRRGLGMLWPRRRRRPL